jgi:hypothetical protein
MVRRGLLFCPQVCRNETNGRSEDFELRLCSNGYFDVYITNGIVFMLILAFPRRFLAVSSPSCVDISSLCISQCRARPSNARLLCKAPYGASQARSALMTRRIKGCKVDAGNEAKEEARMPEVKN